MSNARNILTALFLCTLHLVSQKIPPASFIVHHSNKRSAAAA